MNNLLNTNLPPFPITNLEKDMQRIYKHFHKVTYLLHYRWWEREVFLHCFYSYNSWYEISLLENLSEEFIGTFLVYLDWVNISRKQKLSEDFIRKFSNAVCWRSISLFQTLSENFIREFADRVDWKALLLNDDIELTEGFCEEFKDKLHI